jgi:hypothetical protein
LDSAPLSEVGIPGANETLARSRITSNGAIGAGYRGGSFALLAISFANAEPADRPGTELIAAQVSALESPPLTPGARGELSLILLEAPDSATARAIESVADGGDVGCGGDEVPVRVFGAVDGGDVGAFDDEGAVVGHAGLPAVSVSARREAARRTASRIFS